MYEPFVQQGWQCPVCKRVYAPSTPWCYFCGNCEITTTTDVGSVINKKTEDYISELKKHYDAKDIPPLKVTYKEQTVGE